MIAVGPREMAAAVRVLARGQLARYGGSGTSSAQRFEEELAAHVGVRRALAVNSGTSALVCALVGMGIGPGDEVLVPAYTWVSTAAAVLAVGAIPILVDIDASLTIAPTDLKEKVTPFTRAIIPVHMINLVCDMDPIMQLADMHDLLVVEDACQAIGVQYRGRSVGSIGHAGAFSFNQHKNLKAGEGGAVLTDDDRIFARAGMYHDVGSYTREGRFESDEPLFVGLNLRMPELTAAILRPQLARLDRQLTLRAARRQVIVEELAGASDCAVSQHNDPASAVAVTVFADDVEHAKRLGTIKGVNRLIDTGRHVFTNWQSVLARRSFDERLNPYQWAQRDIEPSADSCQQTLAILERTCSISCDPQIPMPVIKRMARQLRTV